MSNPVFQINQVVFDTGAKEHVMISNGRDGTAISFEPTEAIAIRSWKNQAGVVVMAWTYRRIDAALLREALYSDVARFRSAMTGKDTSEVCYIGRF